MDGGIPLIRPYTVIKDPDGIHAQVVLNEACVLVVRCQYCRKLMLLNDVAERGKKYFCCKACKQAYEADPMSCRKADINANDEKLQAELLHMQSSLEYGSLIWCITTINQIELFPMTQAQLNENLIRIE